MTILLKDPLHTEKTAYEILGLACTASEADITGAFKRALVMNRNANAVNGARLTLLRPVERALLDLFYYRREPLLRLTSDPEGTLLALGGSSQTRVEVALRWEELAKRSFPDLHLVNSLAVLHWWGTHQIDEPDWWMATIGYWVTVAHHPDLPAFFPHLSTEELVELDKAIHNRIRSAIEGGSGAGSLRPRRTHDLSTHLDLEIRAARAVRAVGLRSNDTVLASGPIALSRAGLLEKVRSLARLHGRYASGQALKELRGVLSPVAPISLLIDRQEVEEALVRLWELARGASLGDEGKELRVRALGVKAIRALELDDFEAAFNSWKQALEDADSSATAQIQRDLAKATVDAARKVGEVNHEARITLLRRTSSIVEDEDIHALLGEALYGRGVRKRAACQQARDTADLSRDGASLLHLHRSAILDVEEASRLGFPRAAETLPAMRKYQDELQVAVLASTPFPLRGRSRNIQSPSPRVLDVRLEKAWSVPLPGVGFSVSFSPSGNLLAVGHYGGTTVLHLPTRKVVGCFSDNSYVQAVAFSRVSDNLLFEGSDTGWVGICDLTRGGRHTRLYVAPEEVIGVSPSSRFPHVAVLRENSCRLEVHPLSDGSAGWAFNSERIQCFAPMPLRGGWIVGGQSTVAICHPDEPKIVDTHFTGIRARSIAVSPDESTVAVGDPEGTIHLLDTARMEVLKRIPAHEASVESLSFSHNGRFIVSGGRDDCLWLHSIPDGRKVKYNRHADDVKCVAVSPDMDFIASTSFDNTVVLWRRLGTMRV